MLAQRGNRTPRASLHALQGESPGAKGEPDSACKFARPTGQESWRGGEPARRSGDGAPNVAHLRWGRNIEPH